ncbi:hypothetical protein EDC94DRAFT_599660 [Helicostylum pulchrum]|uniref:F-box domain-containing protein n=1 Tax=Helicostylum pulchrum TaxID=562976 RepID=A0ABP9XRE1_9FUNG|nr:hypothetical protein EDC94DRAFT_599660 [Helicostylum pulchrum]
MIQKLPLELVTLIASYLDMKDTSEFATTCRYNYFAVLPLIWQHLTITDTRELSMVADKLKVNSSWSQRAVQFVRNVSLCDKHQHKKFSCSLAASMFGITSTLSEQQDEKVVLSQPHEPTAQFGQHLLDLFPHVYSILFDYKVALQNFYLSPQQQQQEGGIFTPRSLLAYTGSISVINYESDHAGILFNILRPFKYIGHLKLQTLPVVSLCEDIDQSILTNADIDALTSLGLNELVKLELSLLDSSIELNTFTKLVQSLPRLGCLQLEWVFPPTEEEYNQLRQVVEECAALYPDRMERKPNTLYVSFTNCLSK